MKPGLLRGIVRGSSAACILVGCGAYPAALWIDGEVTAIRVMLTGLFLAAFGLMGLNVAQGDP